MVRRYVTDLIGDDYKKWEPREQILLSYPTGLGKNYFILRVLLRYAAELGEHLVYYCNRKFLNLQMVATVKQQIIAQMGEEGKKLAEYLHVRSYQNAECTGSYPTVYRPKEKRDLYGDIEIEAWRVKYFIFDEAQYPVADSLLNPHTDFWVQCKRAYRESLAIHIYLTATPEPYQLFRSCLEDNLDQEDLRDFLARYKVKQIIEKGGNADYWMQFCSRQFIDLMERHRQIRQNMDQYGSAWMVYRDPYMHAMWCNSKSELDLTDAMIASEREAIYQECKTSFLQMLGRVRVREGQRLKVYIQRMAPKEIKGYIDRCRNDILFLVRWDLDGYLVPASYFYTTTVWKKLPFIEETQQLTKELQDHPHRIKYLVKAKNKSERDEINKLALFHLLGSLYDMEVRAKQHGDGTTDPNYYLRYQLSWLGKTYDPTRWVDYRQTQDGLMEYLGRLEVSGQKIDKVGQTAFRRECLKLLLDLRQTMPYFDSIKVRFSMERQKYPGLKVLNTAFGDAGIPFVIVNRQQGKSRETYWYIEKRNETKEAEHPLQDAPELTESQDISGGSCSPSSGTPVG